MLDIQFLNHGFEAFRDPFERMETQRLIEAAARSRDHAARLAMLWAAMRQPCSVPYTEDEFADARPLWDKALSEWGRSVAWYGLHDDSPLGLLATVNTHNWIRARVDGIPDEETPAHRVHGIGGARASALYSMANRCWRLPHRWNLLHRALQELDAAMAARPERRARYLAIRGSVHRARGQFFKAARDHEEMVGLYRADPASGGAIGEALTELGWTYAWILRFGKARRNLAEGVALMRGDGVQSLSSASFLVRALRKQATIQLLTFDIAGLRRTLREAHDLDRTYLVRDQLRGILRPIRWKSKR